MTRLLLLLFMAALAAGSVACSRERRASEPPLELPVQVLADSGAIDRLRVDPPPARVWIAAVTPARLPAAAPPLPEAALDSVLPEPPLEIDESLKPPILKTQAVLVLPPGASLAASVELDVHVGDDGGVWDVQWVGGSRDSALVAAAEHCARSMRFYPALRGERPVPVWCRQRFDFGARAP